MTDEELARRDDRLLDVPRDEDEIEFEDDEDDHECTLDMWAMISCEHESHEPSESPDDESYAPYQVDNYAGQVPR